MRPPSSQQAGRPSHTAPLFPTQAPGPRTANRRLASTAPRPVYEKLILRGPCKPTPLEAGSRGSPNCFHYVGLRPSHPENEDRGRLQCRAPPKDWELSVPGRSPSRRRSPIGRTTGIGVCRLHLLPAEGGQACQQD